MKKILLSIIACLGLYGSGHAEVSDINLGYCSGQEPTGNIKCSDKEVWVSGAIYIPASTLHTYGGNQINGVNAALKSKLNVEELKVWLRTDLDGENIVEKTINSATDQKIAKGWNGLKFDTPWDIPSSGETGLYIGYSYFQKKTSQGMGILEIPARNALFVQIGDQPWQDLSDQGILCVEALVSGDKLPKVNLALTNINIPNVYIIDNGTMTIGGTVENLATYTVTGFDVNAFVGGEKTGTAHVDCNVPYSESYDFSVELPLGITSLGDGTGSVTVTVDNINEGSDEDMSDNTLSGSFLIAEHDFKHRIFVEEFTTEQCPNCPRVGGYIHNALEKDEFKDDVIVVCHHSGYYTDWLTSSFDANYLWLFNDGGQTYAPAVAVDRTLQNDHTSVWCPGSSTDLEGAWRKALYKPAFVSLNIAADVDPEDTNHITVKVNGAKSLEELCENPTITVYVVEDNIKARSQAGGGSDYIHYHVNRAVNSVWGDELQFDGDDYEYTCEFNLSHLWVRENLQIVAMIGNYNALNAADCAVMNASNLLFSEFDTTAVEGIEASKNEKAEIYSVSGIRMNDTCLSPGIYIRKVGNKTEKFSVK
ncbi:MAG: Omp28-related outer membrane protein [Muribaculaceae bacterium]|nr:Omp28-related outer membrane protein [Muribaculaceae bacterium]